MLSAGREPKDYFQGWYCIDYRLIVAVVHMSLPEAQVCMLSLKVEAQAFCIR